MESTYLIIKDQSTLKPKRLNSSSSVIEPIEFICSENLKNGNDLSLKMKFRASDELELGDWVECPTDDGRIYGGIVLGKSINKKTGIVTYSGLSARGALDGPALPTNSNNAGYPTLFPLEFYDLVGSKSTEYNYGTENHSIERYLNACNSYFWHMPCYFYEGVSDYIPYSIFQQRGEDCGGYYRFQIVNAFHKEQYTNWSPYRIATEYYNKTDQKMIIQPSASANEFFQVQFTPSVTHKYLITDEEVIYTSGFQQKNVFAWPGSSSTNTVVYVDNNDAVNIGHGFSALPITNSKAQGLNQFWNVYNSHKEDGTNYSQEERDKYLVQQLLSSENSAPLQTQITLNPAKISADVGDKVTLIDEELNITSNQIIDEKVFELSNGVPKIKYKTRDAQ